MVSPYKKVGLIYRLICLTSAGIRTHVVFLLCAWSVQSIVGTNRTSAYNSFVDFNDLHCRFTNPLNGDNRILYHI